MIFFLLGGWDVRVLADGLEGGKGDPEEVGWGQVFSHLCLRLRNSDLIP